MSHDQNFKNLILDYPRQAIEFAAASEAARLGEDVRILPLREEQLKERLVARLNLPNMQYAPEEKVEVYANAVRGLRPLSPTASARSNIWTLSISMPTLMTMNASVTSNTMPRRSRR